MLNKPCHTRNLIAHITVRAGAWLRADKVLCMFLSAFFGVDRVQTQ